MAGRPARRVRSIAVRKDLSGIGAEHRQRIYPRGAEGRHERGAGRRGAEQRRDAGKDAGVGRADARTSMSSATCDRAYASVMPSTRPIATGHSSRRTIRRRRVAARSRRAPCAGRTPPRGGPRRRRPRCRRRPSPARGRRRRTRSRAVVEKLCGLQARPDDGVHRSHVGRHEQRIELPDDCAARGPPSTRAARSSRTTTLIVSCGFCRTDSNTSGCAGPIRGRPGARLPLLRQWSATAPPCWSLGEGDPLADGRRPGESTAAPAPD